MIPMENPVFKSIESGEYEEMAACGSFRTAEFQKDSVILHAGRRTDELGILLSGKILIENIDIWGNRMILHSISPGQSFAETYAFCRVPLMVDVIASEDCRVLFVSLKALLSPYNRNRGWYVKILYNLLSLSSEKNLAWSSRMFCISSKSIRARVMNYLSSEARRCQSTEITIPFSRQQMADYLNVERTALSKELGKMQKEGILSFSGNRFRLLHPEDEFSF